MQKNSKTSTSKKQKIYDRRKPITDWPTHAVTFPYRLEYIDKNDKIIAHFECQEHLDKHLKRYNLNPKNSRVDIYPDHTHTLPKKYKKNKLFSTLNDFFKL